MLRRIKNCIKRVFWNDMIRYSGNTNTVILEGLNHREIKILQKMIDHEAYKTKKQINQNVLAKKITRREQGDQVSIAQVKEVLRITLETLANEYELGDVMNLIKKHKRETK